MSPDDVSMRMKTGQALTQIWENYNDLSFKNLGHLSLTYGLTLFPPRISNYIHYKALDEIIYPFLNFNGCTVEV